MAVLEFNPSLDGNVQQSEAGETWANVQGGVGNGVNAIEGIQIYVRAYGTEDKWWLIRRSPLLFDTSSLLDGFVIESARIRMYVLGASNSWDEYGVGDLFGLSIYSSNPASDSELAAGDYNSFGTTRLSSYIIDFDEIVLAGYNNWPLNAAGLEAISKTGLTKLGIREVYHDTWNLVPTWGSGYLFYTELGDRNYAYPPILEITVADPEVRTDGPSDLAATTRTLNGTLVSDGGAACDCGFQWGTTTAYGNTTPTQSKETGETFSQGITGLTEFATYHYRAFATNVLGTVYGADIEFISGAPWSPGGERAGVIRVVEERVHYTDAYGFERWLKGTIVGD